MRQAITRSIAELCRISDDGKRFLASGWNTKVLRTLDLLRKDEWKRLDESVVRVARSVLGAVADLRSAGLTRDLGSIGVMIDEFEKVSEIDEAEQNMTGIAPGQRDLPEYTLTGVPVPITFRDFQVNFRTLDASRTRGSAMDTVAAEMSTRRVSEKLDDMVFNGATIQVDGAQILGYTTHPDRDTGSLTATWTNAGTRDIITDVLAMITALEAKNYRGPYILYVPVNYKSVLREDYTALKGDRTYEERILAIEEIQKIASTVSLTDEVVLVQMTSDVVDLSVGQDITTVEWADMGGLVSNFKIMAAMVPRVKSSAINENGVAHFSV